MFDFASGAGRGGGVADMAMLALGIDASKATLGAAQFGQATNQVRQHANQAASSLGPVTAGFKATIGAIGALGAAMGTINLLSMASQANALAARYDELDISLAAVGKNAGYTRVFLGDLEEQMKKTGISAIQSRQSILSMMQANLDLTQATKLARVAQDVAVVGQINSSDALRRLTYGITSAQTEVLRTIGINVQFEDGYKKLAASMGKTVGELTAQEKTQSRVNAVMAQASKLTGLYEASMNSAGKQMRSTERYVEDLQVKIGAVFQPAYRTLVFGYADALKFLSEWVNTNADTLSRLGLRLDGVLQRLAIFKPFLADTVRLGGDIAAGVGQFAAFNLNGLTGQFDDAKANLEQFSVRWDNVVSNLTRSEDQINAIGTAWNRVTRETRDAMTAQALTGQAALRLGIAQPKIGATTGFDQAFAAGQKVTGGGNPFYVAPDPNAGPQSVDTRLTAAQVQAAREADAAKKAAAATKATEEAEEAAKDAATAIIALRAAQVSLLDSLRDLTPLEALADKLAKMRAEAEQVKMPAAEIDKLEASVLRAAGRLQMRDYLSDIASFSKNAKASLEGLAGVRVDPLVAQMKLLWDVQRDIAALEKEANRAETQAGIMRDLTPVLGEQGARAFANRVADFNAKQDLTAELVGEGMDVTKATAAADRIVTAQGRVRDATNDTVIATTAWLDTLLQVGTTIAQMVSSFGNLSPEARRAVQGGIGAAQGIQTLMQFGGKEEGAVSLGKALSGGAGIAAAASAVSGLGAVAAGLVTFADTIDLFGTKQKARNEQMAENARQWNVALDAFARGGDTLSPIAGAIRALTSEANTLVASAAAGAGLRLAPGTSPDAYLNRAQVSVLRAEADALENQGGIKLKRDGERAVKLNQLADGIEKVIDALDARIRELVPAFLKSIDLQYLEATGRSVQASLQRAKDAEIAAMSDLQILRDRELITEQEYVTRLVQLGVIHQKAVDDIVKAEERRVADIARAAREFDTNNAARIAAASGDAQLAEDIRRTAQYEQELIDARADQRDVTQLLIAQEKEWNEIMAQRAQNAANASQDRQLDGYVRDTFLSNGPIAGALAAASAAAAQEMRALMQDMTLTAEERAEGVRRIGREEAALRAEYRAQYTASRDALVAELTRNPVEAAILESGIQMAAALDGFRDLLMAGIITQAEFEQIEAMWSEKRDRMVAMAAESVLRDQEAFAISAANARANETGTRDDRFAAFALAETTNVAQQIRAAAQLVEQGTITQEMFESFAASLSASVAPALLEVAFAAQEAARILSDNLSTLNQQWTVFGSDANQQLADVTSLFGFGGLTAAEIQAKFTKVTPGVELTAEQRAVNDAVTQWFGANNRAATFNANVAADAAREAERLNAAATFTSGAGTVLRLGDQERTSVTSRSMSEVTGARTIDIAMQQLSVQRAILAAVKGTSSATTPSASSAGASTGSASRSLGATTATTALLLHGVVQ